VKPSVLIEKQAGATKVKIGIIGVTTIDTKFTTNAVNVRGLIIQPLRDAVLREADALKKRGADMLVLAAHAGGKCTDVSDPHDLSSCEDDSEIVNLARALPEGLIDVIVAGHTHNQMAHVVNGSAIVIGWANGKGFSRVDVEVDTKKHDATLAKVHAPRPMCADELASLDACAPPPYEDYRVAVNAKLKKQIAPALAEATRIRERPLGLTIKHGIKRAYDDESALGNLFTDLMRESAADVFHDRIDVAVMNGGGIRADLPEGKLTYGAVFEMMPFDNRYALLKLKGRELKKMLASNLSFRKGGIFSVAGVELLVACEGPKASVEMKLNGKAVGDEDIVHVVTTDFLAGGGDGSLDEVKARPGAHQIDDGQPVREHLAAAFQARARKGQKVLDGKSTELFDPNNRRMKNSDSTGARCKKD
jgi:5'-nucleotidase